MRPVASCWAMTSPPVARKLAVAAVGLGPVHHLDGNRPAVWWPVHDTVGLSTNG